MNNWHTEYRVKYHITLAHDDGRLEVVTDCMIIETQSPEEVEKIILNKFKNGNDALINFPDGWFGHIKTKELEIDEIEKIWEY